MRALNLEENKLHKKIINRNYGQTPPTMIAVVGPPKSGKSTLIKSLIKLYAKQSITEIKGPITVNAGKKRITFFETSNDLNSYSDIGKVADLVLLLIDASFGFEMETFEFLNIIQIHGFPRVMGVLTHLDKIKENKNQKLIKKRLKQRFWKEVAVGSKVFYLDGIRNNLYTSRDILNLSRFIALVKPRPLTWRVQHPYILVDRFEDITNPDEIKENKKINRKVCFYGYLRGTFLKNDTTVHIPGVGDFKINKISSLEDPIPISRKKNFK